MKSAFKKIGSKWWAVTVVLALVAIAGLRARASSVPTAPEDSRRIRYMCVGDLAVDMTGRHEPIMSKELGLATPEQRAFEGCHLPLVPQVDGSQVLVSATSPLAGYGGMVVEVAASPTEALASARAALEQAGWSEQGASRLMGERTPNRALMAFERPGAWLWAVAVWTGKEKTKSAVLVAGQFDLQLWRKNR